MQTNPHGELAKAFLHCLRATGIMYLTNCELDDAVHEPAYRAVMEFFLSSPPEERAKLTGAMRRGFIPLEGESVAKVMNNGHFADYSMAFSMGSADNVFPSSSFAEVWTRYYDQVSMTGARLVNVATTVLRIPPVTAFDNLLRCRHYPDVPEHRAAELEPMRIAAHHDVSFFTLIHQTPCANGFVSNQCCVGNAFVGVPTVPNTIIAQVGALLAILTEGDARCPPHRVAAPPRRLLKGSARNASIMFLRPPPDYPFSVSTAHRLGFAERLRGKTARFGDWIGANDTRVSLPSKL